MKPADSLDPAVNLNI